MKFEYSLIVCKILAYLYECLKTDTPCDQMRFTEERLEIPLGYWKYIIANMTDGGLMAGANVGGEGRNRCVYFIHNASLEITPKGIDYLNEHKKEYPRSLVYQIVAQVARERKTAY